MSIYLGNQEVGVSLLTGAEPIGIDAICNHTYDFGNVVYNGERIFSYAFARTPLTSFSGPNVKRFNNTADLTTDGAGGCVFYQCKNLVSVNFPELLNLGSSGGYQFDGCSALTTVNMPKVASFGTGGYQFRNCTSLTTISFPELTAFGSSGGYQFAGCTALTNISFPKLTTFTNGGYTFQNCTSLTEINSTMFPKLTTFNGGGYHFSGCSSLVTVNLPNLTALGGTGYQFQNCTALTNVNLPKVTGGPGNYAFSGCTSLEHIFLPKFTLSGTYSFNGCTKLLTAVFPCSGITAVAMGGNTFRGCSKLTSVDIGNVTQIKANEFYNCAAMNILVLRRTSVTTLANVSAFAGTPFASGKTGGTLYVPASTLASYQTASNWSTILGYQSGAQNSIKTIESTHEDPDAPIDLTLYYVDGTAIT